MVLLHSIYHCTHFPAGPSTEKGQKIQLSTYAMQTNMSHRQVQQQEPCGFVCDSFGVSGAPGSTKDRSALSVASCCLLTFAHAHYYIVVIAAFQSPHSESNTRVAFGFVGFFCFPSRLPAPKVHQSSPWEL